MQGGLAVAISPGEDTLICPTGWFSEFASSPSLKNISSLPKRKSRVWVWRLAPPRGAYRDRHGTWRGMRWTRSCATAKRNDADGKSVWSRSPDAGIKLAEDSRQATVATKPGHRGERAISRKPSRRECRNVRRTCHDLRACSLPFCTQGCGCVSASGISCALWFSRDTTMHHSGKTCRGNAKLCVSRCRRDQRLSAPVATAPGSPHLRPISTRVRQSC